MHRKVDPAATTRAAVLLLWCCIAQTTFAATGAGEEGVAGTPTVEEILNTKPRPDDYATKERCVRPSRIDRTEILNDRLIVLHLRGSSRSSEDPGEQQGKEKLLLQFAQRCPGLRRGVPLLYEKGNQHRICEHDTVQAFFEMGGGQGRWGPRCILPAFQAVSAEQVEYLKAEIRTNVPSVKAPETGS